MATAMAIDATGNIYLAGWFNGTCDFDPGPAVSNLTSAGLRDVFIAKMDASGNLLWVARIGGTSDDNVNGIAVDASGSLVVGGVFGGGTIDLDPGPGSANFTAQLFDGYILKLDASGSYLWGKVYSGSGASAVNSLELDQSGNVITTGIFAGLVDFDPGVASFNLTATGAADIYISKLDAMGNFIWAKHIDGVQNNESKCVTTDPSGNIYITGYFDNTVDFDPSAAINNIVSAGNYDIFVTKFDPSGNLTWVKTMGGTGSDIGNSVVVDQLGNVVVGGNFSSTSDFNPGLGVDNLTSNGNVDAFIVKLDAFGNYSWARGIGNTGSDQATNITSDNSGNVYLTGQFVGVVDADPGSNTFNLISTGTNAFVTKLNSTGSFLWARNIARSSSTSVGLSLKVNTAGSLYVTGRFLGTADFDTGANLFPLTSAGSNDIFLQKLDQSSCGVPTYTALTMQVCDSFGIAGNTFYSSGFFSNVFVNVGGCDSVVNVALTVNYSTENLLAITTCDSFLFNGQFQTASGTYLDTFANAVGCDSFVTVQLTILHSTFDTLVQAVCDTFDLNGVSYTATGFYSQSYTAANGCDSVIVLDLTILNSLDTVIQSACYSFDFNGTVYTTSGFYTQSYTSTLGCDSIMVLDLTIGYVNTSVSISGSTLTASMAGATYQWVDCGNNYVAVPGETSQSFTPSQTGQYAVLVSNNSCTDTSICTSVTVGIDEVASQAGFTVYPNPTQGTVHLMSKTYLRGAAIKVMNSQGQTVQEFKNLSGMSVNIDLAAQPSGLYFLEMVESDKRVVFKVSKK